MKVKKVFPLVKNSSIDFKGLHSNAVLRLPDPDIQSMIAAASLTKQPGIGTTFVEVTKIVSSLASDMEHKKLRP